MLKKDEFEMSKCTFDDPHHLIFKMGDDGVYNLYKDEREALSIRHAIVTVPSLKKFYNDQEFILSVAGDGTTKSFAYRRLRYLESKFNMYYLLNEYQERADMKKVPHRDFYNVRKVDTHIHHSSCMNLKHLLRFIKSKLKRSYDDVVIYRDEKYLTLAQVFESLNLTAYDLSIDTLDMHVGFFCFIFRPTRILFIDLINLI
jgi:AMP deaminase